MFLPILGLTWVVGVFAVDSLSVPLAYLFTIFNSLQVYDMKPTSACPCKTVVKIRVLLPIGTLCVDLPLSVG